MIKTTDLYLKKKIPEISRLNLDIADGECYVLLSAGGAAVNHLIDIFSGLERDFEGTVEIDDVDIRSDWGHASQRSVYLGADGQWPPDMKAGHVISFFRETMDIPDEEFEELYIKLNLDESCGKRIGELEEVEWRKIIFSMARFKGSNNYIIHDLARGMPFDFNLEFKKSIHGLKKKGCSILYLSDDVFFAPEIGDRVGFMKKGKLLLELKAAKMKRMSLKELYFQFLVEGS